MNTNYDMITNKIFFFDSPNCLFESILLNYYIYVISILSNKNIVNIVSYNDENEYIDSVKKKYDKITIIDTAPLQYTSFNCLNELFLTSHSNTKSYKDTNTNTNTDITKTINLVKKENIYINYSYESLNIFYSYLNYDSLTRNYMNDDIKRHLTQFNILLTHRYSKNKKIVVINFSKIKGQFINTKYYIKSIITVLKLLKIRNIESLFFLLCIDNDNDNDNDNDDVKYNNTINDIKHINDQVMNLFITELIKHIKGLKRDNFFNCDLLQKHVPKKDLDYVRFLINILPLTIILDHNIKNYIYRYFMDNTICINNNYDTVFTIYPKHFIDYKFSDGIGV